MSLKAGGVALNLTAVGAIHIYQIRGCQFISIKKRGCQFISIKKEAVNSYLYMCALSNKRLSIHIYTCARCQIKEAVNSYLYMCALSDKRLTCAISTQDLVLGASTNLGRPHTKECQVIKN